MILCEWGPCHVTLVVFPLWNVEERGREGERERGGGGERGREREGDREGERERVRE